MKRIWSVLAVTGLVLMLGVCLATGDGKAKPKGKFVEPKIQDVDFEDKILANANATYNQELLKARKQYEKVVTDYRKEYLRVLKKNLQKIKDKEEKAKIENEMERINIELAGGVSDVRDESDKFAYGKVLRYKINPTDKWVYIGDLKKGDIVIFEISGKISRDITKSRPVNYKSNNNNLSKLQTINIKLNDVKTPIDTPEIITAIKEKGALGQFRFEAYSGGPFSIGYPNSAIKEGMKPHINGRGHLDVKMKITGK